MQTLDRLQQIRESKISLLKMTHGAIRKISDNIYITDFKKGIEYNGMLYEDSSENLYNVLTGELLEIRNVIKYATNRNDNTNKYDFEYQDGIDISDKVNLVYTQPQYSTKNNQFKIYSELGNLIYTQEVNNGNKIKVSEYLLANNEVLLILEEPYKDEDIAIIYSRNTHKIINKWGNVIRVTMTVGNTYYSSVKLTINNKSLTGHIEYIPGITSDHEG